MWYTYLVPPVLGAIIGYFTNVVAVRMLFRPLTEKRLWGWRIPFTPGLIPKEKGRIAQNVGVAISENLMNEATLEKTLLSDEMIGKIEKAVDEFCEVQKNNPEIVREFVGKIIEKEDVDRLTKNSVEDFSSMIGESISQSDLGGKISKMAVEYVRERVEKTTIGYLSTKLLGDDLYGMVEGVFSKHVNNILKEKSGDIVHGMVEQQVCGFLDIPVCELFQGKEERIQSAKGMVVSAYKTLMKEQLPKILKTINIAKIIEDRVNEMDVRETERLILEVMNKELRAIEWFGALLGGLIGLLNLFLL